MWSDRPTPSRRRRLVETLRRLLPAPRPAALSRTAPLNASQPPIGAAGAFQSLPGFLWLDRPNSLNRFFSDPLIRISVTGRNAAVEGPHGRVNLAVQGLDLVEAALDAWGGPAGASLAGYLGYELGAELENVALPERRPADLPDLVLALYDFSLDYDASGWRFSGTDAWRGAGGLPFSPADAEALLSRTVPAPPAGPLTPGPILSTPTDNGFQAAAARIVRRIHDGEVFQVNVCRRLEAPLDPSNIWPAYLRLRASSPASHGAFLRLGPAEAVLSASPELFLTVHDGNVRTHPIKGTRPRGASPEDDRRLAAELAASEKDRAELAMIVDVMRSDLSRVCRPGSVAVSAHAQSMTLPTVHHLFSEVTGRLRSPAGLAALLRASLPAASISGAPKIHAIELAAQEEQRLRGPCMGNIGWLSLDGRMELSVAIRTAAAARGRIWYLAGCGIVADSDPSAELAESRAKAALFLTALSPHNGASGPR